MHNIGVFPKLFINASIFLFFSLLLVFPKGYNYGSTALLILSVFSTLMFESYGFSIFMFQILFFDYVGKRKEIK